MHRGQHAVSSRENIWFQVAGEMAAQDAKWGRQDHIMVPRRGGPDDPLRHLIASAEVARAACQARGKGEDTWAHILIEEVAEFCDADSMHDMRAELVQVAAVAHQAIAALDRLVARGGDWS